MRIIKLIDLIFNIIVSPVYLLPGIMVRCYRKWRTMPLKSAGSSLLHLSCAASTEHIVRKFGSMEFLFTYDGNATLNLFKKDIYFWFPSNTTLTYELSKRWIILEQKIYFGCLIVSSWIVYMVRSLNMILRENVSLIRAWEPMLSGFSALLLSRITSVPFCVSIHADYQKRYQLSGKEVVPTLFGSRKLAEAVECIVLKRADQVIVIRDSLISYARAKGASHVQVVPHGIDFKSFHSKIDDAQTRSIKQGKKIISSVSRLTKDNYIFDVLAIAEKIVAINKNVLVYVIGDGREYNAIESRIKENGYENSIKLLGYLNRETAIKYRRLSDVNLSLMGGFSLIEAVASGNPTIAYDVEWHHELIKSGRTGYLVKEGDTDRVVQRVIELLHDTRLKEKIGAEGKQLAFDRHDLTRKSDILRGIYTRLLQQK